VCACVLIQFSVARVVCIIRRRRVFSGGWWPSCLSCWSISSHLAAAPAPLGIFLRTPESMSAKWVRRSCTPRATRWSTSLSYRSYSAGSVIAPNTTAQATKTSSSSRVSFFGFAVSLFLKLPPKMIHASRLRTEVEERQGAEAVGDHRRDVQREHRLFSAQGDGTDQMRVVLGRRLNGQIGGAPG
jgi:hypothetical protein